MIETEPTAVSTDGLLPTLEQRVARLEAAEARREAESKVIERCAEIQGARLRVQNAEQSIALDRAALWKLQNETHGTVEQIERATARVACTEAALERARASLTTLENDEPAPGAE